MANGHGGARPGAGRPRKPLAEKILEGNPGKRKPKVLEFSGRSQIDPEPPEYLLAYYGHRFAGGPGIGDIYKDTVVWLEQTGCIHLINPAFIMDYAIVKSHWYEAERFITASTLAYKPGDDKLMVANPVIDVSVKYFKMAESAWARIWEIVQQNSERSWSSNPNDDLMEGLIRMSLEGKR